MSGARAQVRPPFLVLLLVLLAFLAPYVPISLLHPIQFLPLFWWAFGLYLFLSIVIKWRKYSLASKTMLLVGLLMCGGIGKKECRLNFSTPQATDKPLKILTYNIENFKFKPAEIGAVLAFIKAQQPDIVCFQEFRLDLIHTEKGRNFTHDTEKRIAKELGLPYHAFTSLGTHITGTAFFSRFPLSDIDTCFIDPLETNSGFLMTFDTPEGKVGVANLHLPSYKLEQKLSHRPTPWEKVKGFYRLSQRVLALQTQKAGRANRQFSVYPHPLVVVGDMNAPPHSHVIKTLSAGLTDSFEEKGSGWQLTYPLLSVWGIKLDYQFHNDKIRCTGHEMLKPAGNFSDHYPVMGYYAWE